MANRIRFAVSAIPIETLTDENSGTHDIIASEVNRSLSGGGDSVALANYTGTAANQGYKDALVNYISASHLAGGTELTATEPDFVFIRNTGYKFSGATSLGVSTTDCVMVAIKCNAQDEENYSGFANEQGAGEIHYFEIAWLKPGQGIVLPLGANNLSITQFGSLSTDLSNFGQQTYDRGSSEIYVRTFSSTGSAATSGNAVEFLAVT